MNTTAAVVPFYFQSKEVRTINIANEPWFVAKDVCSILGLSNVSMALERIPEQHKGVNPIETLGGVQQLNTVSEPGLYRLILRSDKPQAEPFMEWVTAEVLPTIRKTGGYQWRDSKLVQVNHAHRRDSAAPGGLDIRYTLDLTKVILRPTRTGVELLERLTGVELVDALPEVGQETDLVREFVGQTLQADEQARVTLAELFDHFVGWHNQDAGLGPLRLTKKWFAAGLRRLGYDVIKRGGPVYVFGLRRRSREVIA